MAKFHLFGNHHEPRCETCAHGRLSPDKRSVQCHVCGIAPLDHQCRRYTYDPLRRTPRRAPKPETLEAAAFSLDDTPTFEPTEGDTYHRRMMGELRHYLDDTKDPDVDTILSILHAQKTDTADELFRDATAVDTEKARVDSAMLFSADDSDDIFDDLERLMELTLLTTENTNAPVEEPTPPLDSDSILFETNAPEEEDPLSLDDLMLLADDTTADDLSYDEAPIIPDTAFSVISDDDVEDEYSVMLPVPDSDMPVLNNIDLDVYDN